MLPRNYRFVMLNQSGAPLTAATCKLRPWKFDSAGAVVYGAEITVAGLNQTLPNSEAGASTAVDNSTNLYLGFEVVWSATVGSSQSGTITLYMQGSTDGGTTWPTIATTPAPDEVEGMWLSSIKLNAETSRSGNARY